MKNVDNRLTGPVLRDLEAIRFRIAHSNLSTSRLVEKALGRQEGVLAANGALVVRTGQFTGRSPRAKYIVRDAFTEHTVDWGAVNQPMSEAAFDALLARLLGFLAGEEVFLQDCFAGADPSFTLPVRVVAQRA